MLPIGFSRLAKASVKAEFRILSLSSVSYCLGLGLLVVASSSDGLQHPTAFYVGLIFLAIGMAGQSTTAESFLEKQRGDLICGICMRFILNVAAYLIVNMVGTLFQYFISSWKIKYVIATVFMVSATLIFLSGVCCCTYEYRRERRQTSNPFKFVVDTIRLIVDLVRCIVATVIAFFVPACIRNCLPSCLTMPGEEADEPAERRKEDNAITVHLIPMFMTFIICGVVCSTGYTFFLAQADTLGSKKLVSFLVFFYSVGKLIGGLFSEITNWLLKSDTHNRRRFAPSFGIGLAMLLTILTTITAALVETKRREEKSMTIWWLLPQSVLVGGLDGIYEDSIQNLFVNRLSDKKKIPIFANAVFGAGIAGNALLVFIVSKANQNWIPKDLNSGYLNSYYWLLTVMSALNLVAYIFIAIWFAHLYSSAESTPPVEQGQGESTQPEGEHYDDDGGEISEKEVKKCMCC
ncbi:hypothetical protein Nepgr_032800 [Nepenthes gracilis]|uniref:Uncharacterized protein n=1 Tax=Nepenthes gracilis TaxID=150966 RepID=A0AAD3Y621_NEPGR|nr:hypothetical protein Nepgr_032800 [Nepenthes gracilis]